MNLLSGAIGRICVHLYAVLVCHALWLAGVLAGAVVLGIGPATLALPAALRAAAVDGSARDAARAFIARYRERFWTANGLTAVLLVGSVVVISGSTVVQSMPTLASVPARAALISAAVLLTICAIIAGPADDRLGLPRSPLRALRTVLLYAIARFPATIVALAATATVVLAVLQIPAFVLAFGPAAVVAAVLALEDARDRRLAAPPRDLPFGARPTVRT